MTTFYTSKEFKITNKRYRKKSCSATLLRYSSNYVGLKVLISCPFYEIPGYLHDWATVWKQKEDKHAYWLNEYIPWLNRRKMTMKTDACLNKSKSICLTCILGLLSCHNDVKCRQYASINFLMFMQVHKVVT